MVGITRLMSLAIQYCRMAPTKEKSVQRGTLQASFAKSAAGALDPQSTAKTELREPREEIDSLKHSIRPTLRPADEIRTLRVDIRYSAVRRR